MALWAVYESGVHATIAGVALGLVTPALPARGDSRAAPPTDPDHGSASPCDRLIDAFASWTSYVGCRSSAARPASHCRWMRPRPIRRCCRGGRSVWSPGKLVGRLRFSWLAVRLGLGRLPPGTRWGHIIGLGGGGIGFTVSLFIAGLALDPGQLQDDAKMGVLVASVVAAVLATLVFTLAAPPGSLSPTAEDAASRAQLAPRHRVGDRAQRHPPPRLARPHQPNPKIPHPPRVAWMRSNGDGCPPCWT